MPEQEINIKLTSNVWNIVLQALSKRPFDEVVDIIFAIKQQAEEQLKNTPEES